jgi:hypothetical protein
MEKRKFLTLPGLEFRPLGRPARRQSLYRLRYPGSLRNETIVTKMRLKKDTLQEIEEQQLRWSGRVMRMEDCRIARRVAEWNPQGTRRRDGPVNTWKDGIRDSMQIGNLRDEECSDREVWTKKKIWL